MRLAVVAAVCLSMFGLAVGAESQAAMTKMPTNIPAQGLGPALKTLAKDRGLQVVFRSEVVGSARTQGASGNLTTPEALNELLIGTGLSYSYLDENTVTIVSRDSSGTVDSSRSDQWQQPRSGKEGRNNSSGEFRVAQVDQGPATSDSSVKKGNEDQASSKKSDLEEIVVTGTHIRGAAPSSPVMEITREDIDRSGYSTVGDVLRSLPQNFSGSISPAMANFGLNAPQTPANPTGGSAPDLHGLGASSTLTLVNGRRFADGFGNGTVDISSIPLDAIERIEIVTDGASAIYGSDAVAGVVNIILKKSYDGVQTNLSYGDATDEGGAQKRASVLAGTSWSAGSILLTYEHVSQNEVVASQRSFTSTVPLPYSLLPQSSSNSYLLSMHQDIGDAFSTFVDGNYLKKDVAYQSTFSFFPRSFDNYAPSTQYGVTAGVATTLIPRWTVALVGRIGKQTDYSTDYYYPTATPAARLLDQSSVYWGTVRNAELTADGPLFDFGTGPIRAAIGAGYLRQTFDGDTGSGSNVLGNDGRHVDYVFTELSLPLIEPSDRVGLRRLDVNISGRYEHYSDFGSESVPKIGLVYSPVQDVNLRASWGKSFRAPTLVQLYAGGGLILFPLPNSTASAGTSNVAYLTGSNPGLRPETARSWTTGLDQDIQFTFGRLKYSATYFDINYTNRLSALSDFNTALINPFDAPFVNRNPTVAAIQALVNQYGIGANDTGAPYDPATIDDIVDGRTQNISQQFIKGIDFSPNYKANTSIGGIELFSNVSYLRYEQRSVPLAPLQVLSGVTYNPPRLRARAGVSWNGGPWSVTTLTNYLSKQTNTYVPSDPTIASWTTIDASVSFAPAFSGVAKGLKVTASVQNLFDRSPPFASYGTNAFTTGLNYDPLNTTPIGRFVTIVISKSWF